MQRHALSLSLSSLAILACVFFFAFPSHSAPHSSLRKSALLALVAGDILPENIVFEIRSRGLSFTPDDKYKSLLKDAGAGPAVFAALDTAKITNEKQSASTEDSALLQHLSAAGAKIRAGQLDDATRELTATLTGGSGSSEIGFVGGLVLIKQDRFGEAGEIYSEILRDDPDFPQLHTRLSLTYYQTGDPDEALRQAKAALAENPNNPAAHLNAGLALRDMRKFDAAKSEMEAAIRSKPDYSLVYMNLGILLDDLGDYAGAIAQYKKAVALKPQDPNVHYNLGITYGKIDDNVSAAREYREAKRLDPKRVDVLVNLGATLMKSDPAAAITEFRELVALAPDFPLGHESLGNGLYGMGRLQEAEKEYRVAAILDPANPRPHNGLGRVHEGAKNYDEALLEYRKAEELDGTFGAAYTNAGRTLILKKDFPAAISELKHAEEVAPGDALNHDLRGQAFEGSGDRNSAIAEYKEAVTLAPKDMQSRLDLALALEKNGDWVAALDNYHRAALDEPPPKMGMAELHYDAQHQYESAQQRFRQHLAELRASGKSSEAADLEARLRAGNAAPQLDQKYHDAIQASVKAVTEQRFDDAEASAKQAVEIAEEIQPQDARLAEALGQLGSAYGWRLDYKKSEEAFHRQLLLSEKLYGTQSHMITPALQNLAMLALAQKDFAGAEGSFTRALDLNQKAFGENSSATAETLRGLAHAYFMQQDFAKSESTLLRVVKIYETMYGDTDYRLAIPINSLCFTYDQWDKPEKSAPCHDRLISLEEKQFGANSPYLLRDLNAEAQALHKLGRNDEAVKLEQRTQTLQSAQTKPN